MREQGCRAKMGFIIYRFPSHSLDAVAESLRKAGYQVTPYGPPKERGRGLFVAEKFARARVSDYTEKEGQQIHYVVAAGRNSLAAALFFWPLDAALVSKVTKQLASDGGVYVDPNELL
jgi:hypothetical protein